MFDGVMKKERRWERRPAGLFYIPFMMVKSWAQIREM